VIDAFYRAGLTPNIAMTATDVDVIKSYAEIGLGVAIVPTIACSPTRDRGLRTVNVDHMFEQNIACVMLRKNQYLLPFTVEFVRLIAPHWTKESLELALQTGEVVLGPIGVLRKQMRMRPRSTKRKPSVLS